MAIPIADAGPDQSFTFASLPIAAVALTGGGTDPDLGSIISYQWSILHQPPGATATLSSATAQNPTLNNLTVEGTYMLFLVVEDDQNEFSDGNPLSAPNSARVHINVQSQNIAVVKPAAGERDWYPKYYDLVDAVDANAAGAAAGTGSRIMFSGRANGTQLAFGWHPAIVDVMNVGASRISEAHLAWEVVESFSLTNVSVSLNDGGEDTAAWVVRLYEMTPAKYLTNDFATSILHATLNMTQTFASHDPLRASAAIASAVVGVGNYLALRVETAPLGSALEPGAVLNGVIYGTK